MTDTPRIKKAGGGRFIGEQGQALLGAGGETAQVQLPFGRPAAPPQIQHADVLGGVTDRAETQRR